MKYLKLFVLVLALSAFNVTTATNLNPVKPSDELRIEIVDLIGTNMNTEMVFDEYKADVLFTVNNNRELIVLSVESNNRHLENYLKRRLNYKKVDYRPSNHGEIYLLPVKMIREL